MAFIMGRYICQMMNQDDKIEDWILKKNPENYSLLAFNKSFETLNKTFHRCRLSWNFKIFYITARCLITQEYFYIKKGFENSVFLFGKNYEKYWKISKMTKTPATVYFQNTQFSVITELKSTECCKMRLLKIKNEWNDILLTHFLTFGWTLFCFPSFYIIKPEPCNYGGSAKGPSL